MEKKKKSLYFLVSWGKNKQSAWSGTNWGLYQALSRIMYVEDVDITVKRTLSTRVMNKLLKGRNSNDMGISSTLKGREIALKAVKKGGPRDAVFQFAEVLPDSCGMPTFLYIDLNADYVGYMMDNAPDDFARSNYQRCSKLTIVKRGGQQNKYLETCAGVLTMGEWLAKDLVERCGMPREKVYHVGGGINLDRALIDDTRKKGNKFLFVGRDFERKNGPLVYAAFKLLHKNHPDWELHVAGPSSNPYPDDNSGNYLYHGDCDHKRLSDLFNACDVFVMPSRFEAYGLVFIEALTYGLPCIGRNAYEMPYFIDDGITGRILYEQTPEALSQLMEETMTNPNYFHKVKSQRELYLVEYSWDTVARRIEEAIELSTEN